MVLEDCCIGCCEHLEPPELILCMSSEEIDRESDEILGYLDKRDRELRRNIRDARIRKYFKENHPLAYSVGKYLGLFI